MARVTVEDCLARIPNRFALTILGSRRARSLSEGRGRAMVECDNKEGVTALREISAERVRFKEDVAGTMVQFIEEQRRQLRVTTGEYTFLEAASLRALEDEDLDDDDDDEVETETDDVEELKADPEALNEQAKKSADATSDDDEGESETAEGFSESDGDDFDGEEEVAEGNDSSSDETEAPSGS